MNFSLVITTFNRANILIPKLREYEKYDSIDQIIVADDCSNDYEIISKEKWSEKFLIYKNKKNLKAYKNKINALKYSKNNWTLLIDSDNFIPLQYINALLEENQKQPLMDDVLYCPTFAAPLFNYQMLNDTVVDISLWNTKNKEPLIASFFNTCNFCISKKASNFLYTNLQTDSFEPLGIDCKYMCYILLKNKFKIKGVVNMHYAHNISHDSFYNNTKCECERLHESFNWTIEGN